MRPGQPSDASSIGLDRTRFAPGVCIESEGPLDRVVGSGVRASAPFEVDAIPCAVVKA